MENYNIVNVMSKRKGITFIEMLAVIAIVAIFLMIVVPYFQDGYSSAEQVTTRTTLSELKKAALSYRVNHINGQLPDNLTQLLTGLSAAQSRTGVAMKFIDKAEWFNGSTPNPSAVLDAWGNPITYTKSSTAGESIVSSPGKGKVLEEKF